MTRGGMPDPRFFESRGPVSLGELAALTGATLVDASSAGKLVSAVAPLVRAEADDVSYISDRKFLTELAETGAGACFVSAAQVEAAPATCAVLISTEPQAAYARAAAYLHHARIHPFGTPSIHPDAEIEDNVLI